jgi:hypothetical protein
MRLGQSQFRRPVVHRAVQCRGPEHFSCRLTDNWEPWAVPHHYFFRFRISDACHRYSVGESSSNNVAVEVTQGVFNVLLGDTSVASMSALTVDFTGSTRYLEVSVCTTSGCGSPDVMSPRQRIAASGYALVAENVFGGYASVAQFFQNSLANCDGATDKVVYNLAAGEFSCDTESGSGSGVSSDSLDFDEFTDSMTVDGATTIDAAAGLTFTNASVSGALEIGMLVGGGLADCDADGQTLAWDATTRLFSCGDDDNSVFAGLQVRDGATLLSGISTISFNSTLFDVTASGSQDAAVTIAPDSLNFTEFVDS